LDDSCTAGRRPHFAVPARDGSKSAEDGSNGRFTADEVAALSTERILSMGRRDLIDVIRSVRGGHLLPEVRERLPQMDGETLRRLVFLTRRYCRHRQLLKEGSPAGLVAAYCG
jgi:hypothetical protein